MSAIDLLYARRRRASLAQSAQLERYAFHGTSKSNLRAIRAVGLLPRTGDNTVDDEGKDTEAKVCLALNPKTARKYAGKDGVVLKVDLEEPEVAAAIPQKDKFTKGAVTVNQRIPPDVIQVVKRAEGRGLRLARLSEAYAGDPKPTAEVSGNQEQPPANALATQYGFIQDFESNHGSLGKVTRYFHPRGDRLIVTNRDDLTKPISQHAHWQDRLKGVSGNWLTKWEYHSLDGVKSSGFDVYGLENHLKQLHGAQQ